MASIKCDELKNQKKKLIWQKIAHTGNGKFVKFISDHYPQERIMPHNWFQTEAQRLSPEKVQAVHFDSIYDWRNLVDKFDLIVTQKNLIRYIKPNDCLVFTFLRDPVERIFLMLNSYRNLTSEQINNRPKNMQKLFTAMQSQSAQEILKSDHSFIRHHFHNTYCKSLISDWYNPKFLNSFSNDTLVLEAKLRLKHPSVLYGTTQRCEESLRLLCNCMGWEMPANTLEICPNFPTNLSKDKDITEEDREAIQVCNGAELRLYEWAKTRLDCILDEINLPNLDNQLIQTIDSYLPNFKGWCSRNKALAMAWLIIEERPKVVVEIGVFGGKSFLPQALALKHIGSGIIYGVDPWSSEEEVRTAQKQKHRDWFTKTDYEAIHQEFLSKLKPHGLENIIKIHRMTSVEAAPLFQEIDIIHIDGNHSEEVSCNDVQLYLPKVKRGGFIWFDDIGWAKKARDIVASECQLIKVVGINNNCELYRKR